MTQKAARFVQIFNDCNMQASPVLCDSKFESLDRDGYVILKGVLTPQYIADLKQEVERIKDREGVRVGEHGYSELREKLIEKKSRFRLKCFDGLFLFLKISLGLVIKLIPQVRQGISLYTRVPMDYKHTSSIERELRQMLVCIVEQLDIPTDIRVCDLVNKGEIFDVLYQNEEVLSLVKHTIGDDFKLSSLNLRSPKGAKENQDMHVDYPWAVSGEKFYACNALWLLDDMTAQNGATRILPGTQTSGKMPYEEMPNLKADHPDQILLEAKAGDVLFVNSHVWHGGSRNKSGEDRTIVQSYFVNRAHTPQQHQRFQIKESTKSRLNKESLKILDIHM